MTTFIYNNNIITIDATAFLEKDLRAFDQRF